MTLRRVREFHPHLEILPPAQARLWQELSALPGNLVLYGGTALALHPGHRHSVDFDFFAREQLDPSGSRFLISTASRS